MLNPHSKRNLTLKVLPPLGNVPPLDDVTPPGNVMPPGKELNVPLIAQEQNKWCWAACTEMVSRYYGNDKVYQCEMANLLFGKKICCKNPNSILCNKGCIFSRISKVFKD